MRRRKCGKRRASVPLPSLRIQISNSPPSSPLPARGEREKKTQLRDLAAHFARVLLCTSRPLQTEGAGNAERPMRPIAARAEIAVERTRVSQVTPEITRHSPRNGFNGFLRALLGDRACLPPSPALPSANLTPASGRQDHTTSPSASSALVRSAIRVHRIPPRVRDVAQRPSWRDGTARVIEVIWVFGKSEYFCKSLWTRHNSASAAICPSGAVSSSCR